MLCPTGKKTRIFIWAVIILSCLYILLDPLNRYFQEGILGLVSYKSYLYSAQDMFFALCAVIGLLNLTKYPPLGWTLANIAIAGFIVFPIYCLCAGVLFRTNIMDLLCIMPILSFVLLFVINKKGCRPEYWYFYLRSYIYRVRQPKLSLGRLKIRCNSLFSYDTELKHTGLY